MATTEDVKQALGAFAKMVPALPSPHSIEYPVADVRHRKALGAYDWAHAAGVYCFFKAGHLKYIGRALATTGLASRVVDQATSFGNPIWDEVINDPTATVMVTPLRVEDAFWAASLELYLQEVLGVGLVNKRRC
jgi:hypothetical protein